MTTTELIRRRHEMARLQQERDKWHEAYLKLVTVALEVADSLDESDVALREFSARLREGVG